MAPKIITMEKNMAKFIFLVLLFILVQYPSMGAEFFHKFHKKYTIKNNINMNTSRTISVGLVLVDIPQYREPKTNRLYDETLSYSKSVPFGDEHGRSTNVHETVHGINNQLRNQYKIQLKKNINGFYAGHGRGIIIENPKLTIRDIIPYIPNSVRGYRFNLYFVQQLGDWNDVPTYPIDEWTAYIAGAECAVDDIRNGLEIPKSDYVSGSLEFSIYCTVLAMVVSKKDREYWNTNEQFRNAIQYFLIKAEKVFNEGQDSFPSDRQDKLLFNLRNEESTKELRDFLIKEFQGVFVD
jgi:hypothetical protein